MDSKAGGEIHEEIIRKYHSSNINTSSMFS